MDLIYLVRQPILGWMRFLLKLVNEKESRDWRKQWKLEYYSMIVGIYVWVWELIASHQ